MSAFGATMRMVKFEHSIFALPFALSGAWLAADGTPPRVDLSLIVLAAVFARTAAMAFNRWADRKLDASNPRTQSRELVTGVLSARYALGFSILASAAFVATSFHLSSLCGWLSFPVLGVLLGYSYLKRFTWACHFGLGLALGCAPAGAWLAVAKEFREGWGVPVVVGIGVLLWTAGFDLLYSMQDKDHDRQASLFSIPAQFGLGWTRALAMLFHGLALLSWAMLSPLFLWSYSVGLFLISLLFFLQHFLIRGGRFSRIPIAFFQVNAWVGVIYFFGLSFALPLR
ncbi:MAG: putative 4-hydroxybenzoate polyprenyltransferase [Planctomycetota bacterium]|nr:putative 4-hydroxybenzoate polyprenyltransferase [Planctomycetota bacterium]